MSTTIKSAPPPFLLSRLQALGEEKRIRILNALREGERCVCHLTEVLDMDQPLLSHHLRILRNVGLVEGRKDGRWVHYSLVPQALEEVAEYLSDLSHDASGAVGTFHHC